MTDNYVLPFSLVSVCYLIAACISLGLCHYVRRRNSKSFIKADITDIAEGEELTAEIKEIQIKDKNDPETKEIGEVSWNFIGSFFRLDLFTDSLTWELTHHWYKKKRKNVLQLFIQCEKCTLNVEMQQL